MGEGMYMETGPGNEHKVGHHPGDGDVYGDGARHGTRVGMEQILGLGPRQGIGRGGELNIALGMGMATWLKIRATYICI